jgi:hypothetical protein
MGDREVRPLGLPGLAPLIMTPHPNLLTDRGERVAYFAFFAISVACSMRTRFTARISSISFRS